MNVTRSMQSEVIEASAKKRLVRAVWSDDSTDLYKTAFVQTGIDCSVFADNPVILWEHGKSAERGNLPIANAVEWGVERYKGKNALIGCSRFWDDEWSAQLFERYASGQLKGWSINLLPREESPPTAEERKARPDWAEAKTVYRAGLLLEVSATPIPGNPGTLTLSVERRLGAAPRDEYSTDPATEAVIRAELERHKRRNQALTRELVPEIRRMIHDAIRQPAAASVSHPRTSSKRITYVRKRGDQFFVYDEHANVLYRAGNRPDAERFQERL
jgi:hypothetical protein